MPGGFGLVPQSTWAGRWGRRRGLGWGRLRGTCCLRFFGREGVAPEKSRDRGCGEWLRGCFSLLIREASEESPWALGVTATWLGGSLPRVVGAAGGFRSGGGTDST